MAKHRRRRRNPTKVAMRRNRSGQFTGRKRRVKGRRKSRARRTAVHLAGRAKKRVTLVVYRKNPKRRRKARRNPRPQTLAIRRAIQRGHSPAPAAPKRRKSHKRRSHYKRAKVKSPARRYARRRRSARRLKRADARLVQLIRKYRPRAKGKSRKARRARAIVRSARARRGALRVARGRRYGLSGRHIRRSRAYGLSRMNPSLAGLMADLKTMAVPALVAAAAGVGIWVAGNKGMGMLPDAVKSKIPESVKPYIPAIGVGLASVAAYAALQWAAAKNPKLMGLAPAALFGGFASAGLALVASVQVEDPADKTKKISLAKKYGLPLGEFVGVSGYVEAPNGQMIAVNGIGEFVGVSGQLMLPSGQSVEVNGMGEFVHEEVGLSGVGSIFSNSTLGLIPNQSASQVPLGRDPQHGLSEEVSAEDVLELAEGGSLSGDIFDE